jgi:Fic family protein
MATNLQQILAELSFLKERLDNFRPLSPAEVSRLREYFLVEWTHHSTALEGNTLSLQETRLVLLDGLAVGGKTLREHLEIVDHRDAVEWLENAVKDRLPLSEALIRELHRLVLKSAYPEEAGVYRRGAVRIAGSRHVPPPASDVPLLVREIVESYGAMKGKHPVERAAWLHWRLVWVHPFVDGNGRTARLLMNFSLMRDGYPPTIIKKEERERYLDTLEEASLEGNLEPLIQLVAERVKESLLLYLSIAGEEMQPVVNIRKTPKLR